MLSILFTPKPFRDEAAFNQALAVASWRRMAPEAELLCYGQGDHVREFCAAQGIRQIADLPCTPSGAPRFDWLADHAAREARYDTQVFVNADIVLMPNFADVLRPLRFAQYLCVGERLNLSPTASWDAATPNWQGLLRRHLQAGLLTPNGGGSCDFFAFQRGLWHGVPPVAIGRAACDNCLLAVALSRGVPVIDATLSLFSVHLPHGYKHLPGGRTEAYEGEDTVLNLHSIRSLHQPNLATPPHPLHRFAGVSRPPHMPALADASHQLIGPKLGPNRHRGRPCRRRLLHALYTPRPRPAIACFWLLARAVAKSLQLERSRPLAVADVLRELNGR